MKRKTIKASALFLVMIVLWAHKTGVAQGGAGTQTSNTQPSSQSSPAAGDAADLAKKLSNPIASLISFPLQNNFDFKMGAGSGWRYTLNIQPVIPIAPQSSLEHDLAHNRAIHPPGKCNRTGPESNRHW